MTDTLEDRFLTAHHQLKALVHVHRPAIASSGISIDRIVNRTTKNARIPRYIRYSFSSKRPRGQDTAAALASISVDDTDPATVTIWQIANLSQPEQVAWWDKREKSSTPLSALVATNLFEFVLRSIEKGLDATRSPVRTTSPQLAALLYELCVNGGFCLPRPETESLLNNPPDEIDQFTDAIFRAEKMDPHANPHLRAGVRATIGKYIQAERTDSSNNS